MANRTAGAYRIVWGWRRDQSVSSQRTTGSVNGQSTSGRRWATSGALGAQRDDWYNQQESCNQGKALPPSGVVIPEVRLALGVPEQSAKAILSHSRIQVRRKGEDAAGALGYSSTCFHLRAVNGALYSCCGEEEVKHSTRLILLSCRIQVRRKVDDCGRGVGILVHLCHKRWSLNHFVLVRLRTHLYLTARA